MLKSKNFSINSKNFYQNLKKTKKIFNKLKLDLKNSNSPLLESYDRDYEFDFSTSMIRKFSKYNNIIIFGMGGSVLGAKCIYSFFKKKIKKTVFFFDNLDSNLHFHFKKIKNLKNSCFVVISKSGNTIETISNLSIIFAKSLLKNKLVVITELKDSSLIDICNKINAEIIEHKDFIGGRYSVLSEVGMFPAALMGLNIQKFKNVKKLINNKLFSSLLIKNAASIYTLYNLGIRNSVILNYDSDLNDLAYWYQQLIGESLGKKGKGITPIISPAPKDHHSMLQLYLDGPKDKFYTFLGSSGKSNNKIPRQIIPKNMRFLRNKNLNSIVKAQHEATSNIFKLKNIPFRKFIFTKNKEEELGEIFTFLVLETIVLAHLLNVNPFDQPAVEQVKNKTQEILSN